MGRQEEEEQGELGRRIRSLGEAVRTADWGGSSRLPRSRTLNKANGSNSGVKAGLFGGVALFAVIFFASGIPRIQKDILMVRGSDMNCVQRAWSNVPTEGSFP